MNSEDVFINCPFSDDYDQFFRAIVFTVIRSGFTARCAREEDDGGDVRFEKICRIISECKYGIHDISKTELDVSSGLPRFNMPFELGLFLGARKYGETEQQNKKVIILDIEAYRYQQFLSDISGQDIHSHNRDLRTLIIKLAGWLRRASRRKSVPDGIAIAEDFDAFTNDLPLMAERMQLGHEELTYADYQWLVSDWLAR